MVSGNEVGLRKLSPTYQVFWMCELSCSGRVKTNSNPETWIPAFAGMTVVGRLLPYKLIPRGNSLIGGRQPQVVIRVCQRLFSCRAEFTCARRFIGYSANRRWKWIAPLRRVGSCRTVPDQRGNVGEIHSGKQ